MVLFKKSKKILKAKRFFYRSFLNFWKQTKKEQNKKNKKNEQNKKNKQNKKNEQNKKSKPDKQHKQYKRNKYIRISTDLSGVQSQSMKSGNFIQGYVVSHVGLVRSNNEDNFLLNQSWNKESEHTCEQILPLYQTNRAWCCATVFDGMGGGEKGEWASLVAAEEFNQVFSDVDANYSLEQIDGLVRNAFLHANKKIVEEKENSAVFGTTGTVLCTNGIDFKIYHLGDSRAYLLRDGELYLLTQDQTLAAMKLRLGFYESEEEVEERDKHQLTEFIGCDMSLENLSPQESEWNHWSNQDKILLCSDGLYDMCSQMEIRDRMKQNKSLQEIANELMQLAIEHGGRDNITCLLLMLSEYQ